MHWIIQKGIFKALNYERLTDALDRLGLEYTSVEIPAGTWAPEPDVNPSGPVYVCGAVKLAKIAAQRGWSPGSFLNESFRFDIWQRHLGAELLSRNVVLGTLAEIEPRALAGPDGKFFIRPVEDNKAFDGQVIDLETLTAWRRDPAKRAWLDLDVVASPVQAIYREYRLFVVRNRVVTGSVYKVGGRPQLRELQDSEVESYAESILKTWTPAESVVLDVALTEKGFKVIEFNNINSSGFYAADVMKYAIAVADAYG